MVVYSFMFLGLLLLTCFTTTPFSVRFSIIKLLNLTSLTLSRVQYFCFNHTHLITKYLLKTYILEKMKFSKLDDNWYYYCPILTWQIVSGQQALNGTASIIIDPKTLITLYSISPDNYIFPIFVLNYHRPSVLLCSDTLLTVATLGSSQHFRMSLDLNHKSITQSESK